MTLYRPPASVRAARLPLMQHRVLEAAHEFAGSKLSPAYILHWVAQHNDLRMWPWPADAEGNRVPPDELPAYKLTHYFLGPCCFCAYLDDTVGYSEARIQLLEFVNTNRNDPNRRPFIGEWVAECAREDSCGYFERFFACKVLLTKKYRKRDKPTKSIDTVFDFLKSDEEKLLCGAETGLRRIFTPHTDDENLSRSANKLKRIREEFPEDVEKIESQIDFLWGEGLSASEFWKLFVQCARCGFVMAKHRYPYSHRCPKRPKPLEDDLAKTNETGDSQNDDEEENEDAITDGDSRDYDYYYQFASAPATPQDDVSSDSEWEIDPEDFPVQDYSDDDLPDPLTVLTMMGASRDVARTASSH
ncbi:hypothetical protein EST38_g9171 [Candolleomyces aberdarensis]|uniref:Uncharacterized protein n=1 Tax=Candolleomyces aberdarensis TaxID=2316362 RepID=A0A4Q2DCT4_9AGAR|nr:hypothetical protein EST38_g9171 [Candolleomyces aberdarensis]